MRDDNVCHIKSPAGQRGTLMYCMHIMNTIQENLLLTSTKDCNIFIQDMKILFSKFANVKYVEIHCKIYAINVNVSHII